MNFIREPSLSVRWHSRQLASTRQLHIPRLWKITAQQRAGSGSRQPSTDIAVTPPASTSSLLHTSRDRNQLKHPTLHGRGKATTVWGRTEMARAIQEDVERFYLSSPPGLSHGGRKEPLPALCLETGKTIYKLLLPLERSGATRQRSPLKWEAAPQHFPVSGSAGLRAGSRRWQHKGAAGPREETARSSQGWLQQLRPSKTARVRGTSPTRPARGRGRGFGERGWHWAWERGGAEKAFVSPNIFSLAINPFFPQVKTVLPVTVLGTRSPCFEVNPLAFWTYFPHLLCGGRGVKGCVSVGKPRSGHHTFLCHKIF